METPDFSIKTKRELLGPEVLPIFDDLEVGKCGTVNTDDFSVEVCKLDAETADIRVRLKPER